MEFDQLLAYLLRWITFAGGFLGLLYYFNFVQTEYFKEAEAPAPGNRQTGALPSGGSGSARCLLFSPDWHLPDIWAAL